jgi:hypothetical protein
MWKKEFEATLGVRDDISTSGLPSKGKSVFC